MHCGCPSHIVQQPWEGHGRAKACAQPRPLNKVAYSDISQESAPYLKAGFHLIWCGCPSHIVQGTQEGHGRAEKWGEVVRGQPQGKREHAQQAETQRQHRAKIGLCGQPILREQVLSQRKQLTRL